MIDQLLPEGGDVVTPETNPTNGMSDVIIEGAYKGTIFLQMRRPDAGAQWHNLVRTIGTESQVVLTPDPALEYRFRGTDIVGTPYVYFGP